MTASSRLLPLRPADHRTHRRRGSPPARTMASRRGAVDRWRADIDARVRAETPAGYHLYNRSVPWKEIPTRTRHLQVHLFENRPSLAPDQILEADASIRREKEAEHRRRQAKDAAWLRTEARLREDAARLKALDAARDAPTEVSELVRPHARNRHGEVVDNSGQYLKTGTRAKHLIPTPKGRVPLAQGRAVPVQFSVKHHPREWRDELDDRDENARLRARDPDQDPDADENDRGALAVGEEGPSRAPSAPPSRARTPSRAATPSFAPAGCPPSRAPTPASTRERGEFVRGRVRHRASPAIRRGRHPGGHPGGHPFGRASGRASSRADAATGVGASAKETPLGPRSAAIVDRPPSPPGLDTSSRPALRQNVNPTTHAAPTNSADPRPARVSSSSRPSSAPAGPRRVLSGPTRRAHVRSRRGGSAAHAKDVPIGNCRRENGIQLQFRRRGRGGAAQGVRAEDGDGFGKSVGEDRAAADERRQIFRRRRVRQTRVVEVEVARVHAGSPRPIPRRTLRRGTSRGHAVVRRRIARSIRDVARSGWGRGGGVVRPGSTTMEAAANNAPREKGTPRKAVVRPASAFRGEEGRFRGELTRTDVEGEGARRRLCSEGGRRGTRGRGTGRGRGGRGTSRRVPSRRFVAFVEARVRATGVAVANGDARRASRSYVKRA